MQKRILRYSVCVLLMVVAASATDLRAQDRQGYASESFAANPTRVPEVGNQPQAVAATEPKAGENTPPDYSALPPPPANNDDQDLARRVADLEKQLADYAKAAEAAKTQVGSKPLVAPSGRIRMDVANFTQNAASDKQFGNAQNTVGFRRAASCSVGREWCR